ncbi:MAG TPA: hypothetical protein VGF77_11155 [Allosphingosinicella sp.]
MSDEEAPTKEMLIEARERIVAQLDAIRLGSHGCLYPPDYRGLVAELQGELGEIDAILNAGDSPDT